VGGKFLAGNSIGVEHFYYPLKVCITPTQYPVKSLDDPKKVTAFPALHISKEVFIQ
jgi:hypothetical protein